MSLHSMLMIVVLIVPLIFGLIQSEPVHRSGQHYSKSRLPSVGSEEASQWLSSHNNIPQRWQHLHANTPLNEIDRTYKQFQLFNDNGIRQYDMQQFEGVPMEVYFEVASSG